MPSDDDSHSGNSEREESADLRDLGVLTIIIGVVMACGPIALIVACIALWRTFQ